MMYRSIPAPPVSTGGRHHTTTDVDVGLDPTTPVGAPGTLNGEVLTDAEAADDTLHPADVCAFTRNW